MVLIEKQSKMETMQSVYYKFKKCRGWQTQAVPN